MGTTEQVTDVAKNADAKKTPADGSFAKGLTEKARVENSMAEKATETANRLEILERLFRSVHKSFFHVVRSELKKRGLPPQSMAVMGQILRSPGMTISDLARATGNVKSHISDVVENLTEIGFLEKVKDSCDMRLVRIHATEKAKTEFKEMRKGLRNRLSVAIEMLPEERIDAIIEGLRSLDEALKEEQRGADRL